MSDSCRSKIHKREYGCIEKLGHLYSMRISKKERMRAASDGWFEDVRMM